MRLDINLLDIYDYTLNEITTILKGKSKQLEQDHKATMINTYNNACTIAIMVGSVLSGKKFPKIEKIFPNIYTEDELAEIQNQELMDYIYQFASANNLSIEKEQTNDIRQNDS